MLCGFICDGHLDKRQIGHWTPEAAPRDNALWLRVMVVLINVRLDNLTALSSLRLVSLL